MVSKTRPYAIKNLRPAPMNFSLDRSPPLPMAPHSLRPSAILSQNDLAILLQEFKAQHGDTFHLTALGYFGSYARGEARPDSDIDIIFQTDRPNLWTTAHLYQDLQDWLQHPIDLVRFHDYLSPAFKQRLEQEAIYV